MKQYIIEGGHPLFGEITISGAKNAAVGIIPAALLVAQSIAALFGFALPVQAVEEKLLDLINAVFGLLTILGIVNDPTTRGLRDSTRALEYQTPN